MLGKKPPHQFLNRNNFINYCNQYSFRKYMGIHGVFISLSSLIYEAHIDKGNKCLAIFIDIAKAFNSVSHNILNICKLHNVIHCKYIIHF